MFQVDNKDTRTTLKRHSGVYIVVFWTYLTAFFSASVVDFEQVNACWVGPWLCGHIGVKQLKYTKLSLTIALSYKLQNHNSIPQGRW